MKSKCLYLLTLFVIGLLCYAVTPTYAKFTKNFTIDEDVVGLNFDFDLGINNIEEYEEVNVLANSTEIFNVEINNSVNNPSYYGIWYKMTTPKEKPDNVIIARLETAKTTTSGSINANETITTTIILINNTSTELKINIGVSSSKTSTKDIEYLGGKKLISGTAPATSSGIEATTYIENLYNNSNDINTVNVGGDVSKIQVKLNETQGIMLDNNKEYRYYGKNPNNYVEFNDELWRIISISNVEDENGNISKQVKLIRNESIGNYSYDNKKNGLGSSNSENGSNDWTDSRLMMLLNPGYEKPSNIYSYEGSLYWNSKSGTCYAGDNQKTIGCDFTSTSKTKGLNNTAKNMISKSKFYLGGQSHNNTKETWANNYYDFERNTETYNNHKTEWTGYIGLIYPSDYLYATDLSLCTNVDSTYNNAACNSNNWLLSNDTNVLYTITPYTDNSYEIFSIKIDSPELITNSTTNTIGSIKPTLYLKENVTITSGKGTISNPYKLALK